MAHDVGIGSGELREDIPLKSSGRHHRHWTPCWNCTHGDDCIGGSRLVSTSFAVLSAIITFALLLQIYYGDYQVVPHGSVASDSRECSEIGTATLKMGGNAADAAIATAFCLAVVNPHVTGLDAEGQFMIYNHRTRDPPQTTTFRRSSHADAKIAELLPRLVIGLAAVHLEHGTLAWRALIAPAVTLARRGFLVSRSLAQAMRATPAGAALYGHLEAGQVLRLPRIAATLASYADIAAPELRDYITLAATPTRATAVHAVFGAHRVYVPAAPTAGPALLENLRRIDAYNFSGDVTHRAEFYYRIAESTRATYDERNVSAVFHEGTTSNVAVIDKDDNYVSFVTGLYQLFGSQELNGAGYIVDERPPVESVTCSRLPMIITDAEVVCGRRLILGANNIASASQILAGLIIAGYNVTTGIEIPRFNLLQDGTVGFEDDHSPTFPDEVIEYLETLGHPMHMKEPYGSCNVVEKLADILNSHSDSRGGGIASRFR